MDKFFIYIYLPVIVLGGVYLLYDRFIVAPRSSKATLDGLQGFETDRYLFFNEGIIAFDFSSQRIAIVKRVTTRTLDISEVRDGTGHWTNVSSHGTILEKDFYVLLTIADINEPEIRIGFRAKGDLAICLEIIRQVIERRYAVVSDAANRLPEASKGVSVEGVAVIVTAIEVETRAVLSHLDQTEEELVAGTLFHKGVFPGVRGPWMVAVAEVGPRNVNAGLIGERAIQFFRPNLALFVGIAGGIKDVKLGDVVAATKVYAYGSGKETRTGFVPRPELRLASHTLEQRARSVRLKGRWLNRLRRVHPETPSAFVEPIAAGDILIGTSKSGTALLIRQNYSDAVAAEMEGCGFLSALHLNPSTRGIVIRGISDLFDGKSKTDAAGWQLLAADSAAAFAFQMLSEIDIHASVDI